MRRSALNIIAGVIIAIAAAAVVLQLCGVPVAPLGAATISLPPSLIVIWLAEARRIRGLAFWAPVGAALGAFGYVVLSQTHAFENWNVLLAMLGGGAMAGWIYWAIAGRQSGTLAAAIDKSGQDVGLYEPRARRCWVCTTLLLLVGLVPLTLIAAYGALTPDATWPRTIAERAQTAASRKFADAGFEWASLKITDHVGHIAGTAPNADARDAAFAKAGSVLGPMIGRPGIVAYLQNDITVAQQPGPTLAERVLAGIEQKRRQTDAKRKVKREAAANARKLEDEQRAAERKRKAEQYAAKARAAEEMRAAAVEAKRKSDAAVAVAAAAAKVRALEEERLAADAKRKVDEEKRLALETEREKSAVAAAHKAEAADANADKNQKTAPAAMLPASNCDSDFSELFKSTSIQFASRSTGLNAELSAFLDSAAALSKRCTEYGIDIAGHADRNGTEAVNLATSLARAVAVRNALLSRGVPNDRLTATGYGDSRPLNPARNRAAFERNRRVEMSARRISTPPAQTAVLTIPDVKPFKPAECHTRLTDAIAAADLRFAVNSTRVRRNAANDIRSIARVLRRCPDHALAINGHTDRRGAIEANRSLSEKRAGAVRDLLIARGVPADRLLAVGHGALVPKSTGESLADFARNRRVDFDVSATASLDSR